LKGTLLKGIDVLNTKKVGKIVAEIIPSIASPDPAVNG
jgi:hypothetical protein